jgi:hypothetical protein
MMKNTFGLSLAVMALLGETNSV